jgi:hypothetical protein
MTYWVLPAAEQLGERSHSRSSVVAIGDQSGGSEVVGDLAAVHL